MAKLPPPIWFANSNYPSDSDLNWTDGLQGVTHSDHHWYISQTQRLWKIDVKIALDQDFSATNSESVGFPSELSQDYDHMGDIDYYDGFVFAPFEKGGGSTATALIGIFDASNLHFIGWDYVAPEQGIGAPWVAVNPADGLLYSSPFDDVSSLLVYKFNINGGNLSLTLDHRCHLKRRNGKSLKISGIQGAVFTDNNLLFIVSDKESTRGIYEFEMPEARMIDFMPIPDDDFDFGQEREGITYWNLRRGHAPHISGQLHVLEGHSSGLKCFKHYSVLPAKYVANKNPRCREVHKWDCTWVGRMLNSNKVPYAYLREAIQDGYDGCHYCLPQYDTR
jgi:hypothetical protein